MKEEINQTSNNEVKNSLIVESPSPKTDSRFLMTQIGRAAAYISTCDESVRKYVEPVITIAYDAVLNMACSEDRDLCDKKSGKTRGFEFVSKSNTKSNGVTKLPRKATANSAAYDFYSPVSVDILPGEKALIWTDIKSYMKDKEVLIINVRSSAGKHPVMLANTQGWIDADYYNNMENEGNIAINILNIGKKPFHIKEGDRIAQGMFVRRMDADDGDSDVLRKGGHGSSGR